MTDNTKNNRIQYVDVAKGISILLVLFGHLLPNDSFIKSAIYAFHMPLFFCVSGIVLKQKTLKEFAVKRWYQILLPYFLWAFIFASFSIKNCVLILYGSNESLIAAGSNGMLWFLMTMFIGSVLAEVIISHVKNIKLEVFAGICFLACSILLRLLKDKIVFFAKYGLPFALDVACLATVFILTGHCLIPLILNRLKQGKGILLLILGILMIAVSCLGNLYVTEQGYPQMATLDVGYVTVYYIVAIVSVVGIMCLSLIIERDKALSDILSWFGRNSLLIFITHRIILYQIKDLYLLHDNLIVLIVMFVVLTAFSSVCAIFVNKFIPVLAGKQKL